MDYFEKQAAKRNLVKLAMAIRATRRLQKQGGVWDNVKGAWGSVSDAARRGWNTSIMQINKFRNGRVPWATDYRPEGAHTDHLTDEEWRLLQTVPPEVQKAYSTMVKRRYSKDPKSFALNSQAAARLLDRGRQLYRQQRAWEASGGEPGRVPEAFGMQKDYDRMMRQADAANPAYRNLPTILGNNRVGLSDEINRINSREDNQVNKAIAKITAGIASDNSYNNYLKSIRRSLPSYLQFEGYRGRNTPSMSGGESIGTRSTGWSLFNPGTWETRSGSSILLPRFSGFRSHGPDTMTDMVGNIYQTPKSLLRKFTLADRAAKNVAMLDADKGTRFAVDPANGYSESDAIWDDSPLSNTNGSKGGWSLATHGTVPPSIVKPKLTFWQRLGFGNNADKLYKINPKLTRDNYQDHVRRVGVNNLSSNDLSLANSFQRAKREPLYVQSSNVGTSTR